MLKNLMCSKTELQNSHETIYVTSLKKLDFNNRLCDPKGTLWRHGEDNVLRKVTEVSQQVTLIQIVDWTCSKLAVLNYKFLKLQTKKMKPWKSLIFLDNLYKQSE